MPAAKSAMAEETSQTVLRRTQGRIPARRAGVSKPAVLKIAAVAVALAIVAGFFLRPLIEAALVLSYARSATGLQIDVSRVERIDGGYAFADVAASTPDGSATLHALRADVTTNGGSARIALASPHLTLAPGNWHAADVQRTRDALHASGFGRDRLTLEVRDGSASVVGNGSTPRDRGRLR